MRYKHLLLVAIYFFSSFTYGKCEMLKTDSSPFYIDPSLANFIKVPQSFDSKTFHLISHGAPGRLFLNHHWMGVSEIAQFIKPKLDVSVDHINIYGCEFAQGAAGRKAVAELEKLLHVSIAASTNITGKNGDWVLEVGDATTAIAFNYDGNLQYQPYNNDGTPVANGALGEDYDGDGIINSIDLDDDNDGILDVTEMRSGCDSLYGVATSRLVWSVTNSSTYTSTFTKDGSTITATAVITPTTTGSRTFNGLTSQGYNYANGTYVGCPDGVTAINNSVILVLQMNYQVTITFSQPVKDPAITFSSFNSQPINLLQTVYVSGSQPDANGNDGPPFGTGNPVAVVGTYTDTLTPVEGLVSVVYPGYYSSIAFTTVDDNNAAFSVAVSRIMPPSTPTFVSTIYYTSEDKDTDGDGIPNRLDLDSDGDKCPDAYEVGVPGALLSGTIINTANVRTSPNAIVPGPYGANGLANYLESGGTDQGASGTTSYAATYSKVVDSSEKCPALVVAPDNPPYTVGSTSPTTFNVLSNDSSGAGPVPSTLVLIAPAGATRDSATGAVTVPGEGVWTVNSSTGAITFTPNSGFAGPPSPITYTVSDVYGNVSDPGSIAPQGAPLEINLISFNAIWDNNGVPVIFWEAIGENGDTYGLQRSFDGDIFNDVETIKVKKPNVIEKYKFSDIKIPQSTVVPLFYRLNLKSNGGNSFFSKIVRLEQSSKIDVPAIFIAPNPAKENIHFNSLENVKSIEIRSLTGQVIKQSIVLKTSNLDYSVKDLNDGSYIIVLQKINGGNERIKLIISKQ